MPSLMTNEHGDQFDKAYFTFKVELGSDQKGRTKYGDSSVVELGVRSIISTWGYGNGAITQTVYNTSPVSATYTTSE